ncbi:MAG TPA: hypothetical protein VD736_09620 [Nitrososphaera sp.]|nr:hypothetical protein [Nitrososphaera sp.]
MRRERLLTHAKDAGAAESIILLERLSCLMRLLLAVVAALLLFLPAVAVAQNYQVIKTDRSESFVLPYDASNRDDSDPLVYTFDAPKDRSWILSIRNGLSYVPNDESKTVIRLQEAAPSEKYVELMINGGESKRYWVAVNTVESGYARLYDENNGWSTDEPISVTFVENSGLTVTNGKRIVVDRLDVEGFVLSSIAVYGNNDDKTAANTYGGDISFEVLFGSFEQSSLYYVPAAVTAGVGAVIVGLLIFKKRKP